MKRLISAFLSIVLLASVLPIAVKASPLPLDDSLRDYYLVDQYHDDVWERFGHTSTTFLNLITNRTAYAYVPFADKLKNDWKFRSAIKGIEVLTDDKHQDTGHIEILMNLLMLMEPSRDLKDIYEYQKDADTNKPWYDYLLDAAGIAFDWVAGMDKKGPDGKAIIKKGWQNAATIAGISLEFVDKFTDRDEFKYFNQLVNSYEMYQVFLDNIIKHSTNKKLVEAAKVIQKGNSIVFSEKAQIFAKQLAAPSLEATWRSSYQFFDNIALDILSDPNSWSSADKQWAGKFAGLNVLFDGWGKIRLGADMAAFGFDVLFQYSDVLNRVNEVFILSDIFEALEKSMDGYIGPPEQPTTPYTT